MRYSYVIIDNDDEAVDDLRKVLGQFPDYYCRGVAKNEEEAINLVMEQTPQLVFLEPEVPGEYNSISAFSVIKELKGYLTELPMVIVVTKSIEYSIQAIRNDVLDYVLKPSNVHEIRKALFRYKKKRGTDPDTICIKSYGDYKFIEIDDIQYLKADNNNTDFFLNNGNKISAFKTLKHFETALPDYFVRVHNSYIINTNYVSRIHFGRFRCSIKSSDELIPFSRTYKQNVELIKNSMKNKNILEF